MNPKYPIFIPSKGRWEKRQTAKRLDIMRVPYRIVVEPAEYAEYAAVIDPAKIICTPENFSELGQGSIPVRNFIWDTAIAEGHARHWIIDDNINNFYRMHLHRKVPVASGTVFACAENFTDRYENIAFSGFNNLAFSRDCPTPFILNTRIYSITLINTALPYRWRGRYNEDTDICLCALKDGWVTMLFHAFLADKATTMTQKGGNTETIYNTGDNRREFAESLARQHPDVASVVWKFNRWHHQVNYSPFKRNKLIRRPNAVVSDGVNEYGMKLVRVNP